MTEKLKPVLITEARAIITDLHAAGYDAEFEKRDEHGITTFKVEAVVRGQERGAHVRIVGREQQFSEAIVSLAQRMLPKG